MARTKYGKFKFKLLLLFYLLFRSFIDISLVNTFKCTNNCHSFIFIFILITSLNTFQFSGILEAHVPILKINYKINLTLIFDTFTRYLLIQLILRKIGWLLLPFCILLILFIFSVFDTFSIILLLQFVNYNLQILFIYYFHVFVI